MAEEVSTTEVEGNYSAVGEKVKGNHTIVSKPGSQLGFMVKSGGL